jgi:hypothetical protein
MKIDAVKISRQEVPLITVKTAKDKPKMTIHHIIHSLKFIPGKIIIYEDRPECFIEVIQSLRQLFPRTEIVIDRVSLNPPGMTRQIKSIKQDIFPVK